MDAFKITCVTCNARLSVRDEKLIGQILGCPKCGSMVQVTAPAARESSSPNLSSVAAAAFVVPAAPEGTSTVTFDDVEDLGAPVNAKVAPPAPTAPQLEPASAAAGMAPMKLAAILVAGALAGSGLVAGALMWLSSDPVSDAPHAVQASPAPAVDVPPVDVPPVAEQSPVVAEEEPKPEVVSGGSAAEPAETDGASSPPHGSKPQAAIAEPNLIAQAEINPPQPPEQSPAISEAAPAEKPATAPTPRLRIDPLDIDPEGLDLNTLFNPEANSATAASEAEQPPTQPVVSEAPSGDVAAPGAAARPAPRREAEPAAPPNAAALLDRRLAALKVDRMPLCRFLDFTVQLSGMPVSVAPEELEMARVSAATVASVEAKDATIEQLLAKALTPLRLTPVVEGSQITMRFADADRRRELVYPIDDLASDAEETQQLADWIQQLVAPETWQAAGGDGVLKIEDRTLRVDQTERVQYGTLLLLERYRLARGLPTRSKYPAELLSTRSADAELAQRMRGKTTFTFTDYAPLREVFRYWQEELEVAVLVDWPALAEVRLWPQTRIVTSAVDKPWETALDESLAPLGLAWRPAGPRAIEITSQANVQSEPRLAIYRLAPDVAATSESLTAKVGELASGDPADAPLTVALDASNHVLLVRHSASVQRALAAWLGEQGLLGER